MTLQQQLARSHRLLRENAQRKSEGMERPERTPRSERTTSNYGISRLFGIKYVPAGQANAVEKPAVVDGGGAAANRDMLSGDLGAMRESYFTEAEDGQNPFKKRRSSIFGNAGDSLFGN